MGQLAVLLSDILTSELCPFFIQPTLYLRSVIPWPSLCSSSSLTGYFGYYPFLPSHAVKTPLGLLSDDLLLILEFSFFFYFEPHRCGGWFLRVGSWFRPPGCLVLSSYPSAVEHGGRREERQCKATNITRKGQFHYFVFHKFPPK